MPPTVPDAFADEQRYAAEAKLKALTGVLTSIAAGWSGWEPTPRLMFACADLAASVARHLELEQAV